MLSFPSDMYAQESTIMTNHSLARFTLFYTLIRPQLSELDHQRMRTQHLQLPESSLNIIDELSGAFITFSHFIVAQS